MSQDEQWLLKEKYNGEISALVFNESLDEIKNKYSWGEGFFADCARLTAGEPLGYVIGFVPFLNCRIYLDSKPLIPRTETEFWTGEVIKTILPRTELGTAHGGVSRGETSGQLRVLDLCAGSGCIGVAINKAIPSTHITFGEIEESHLTTIEKNCLENGIDNYSIIQSDLFANISGQFDYIVSNPPYIDPTIDRAESSVKNYEPHVALYGGEAGLELIEKIINQSPAHLTQCGQLWMEHEPEHKEVILTLANGAGFDLVTTHSDQYGIPRFSVLTMRK